MSTKYWTIKSTYYNLLNALKIRCMKTRPFHLLIVILLFSGLFIISCQKNEESTTEPISAEAKTYDATVPLSWFNLLVEIDRYAPNYRPPAAARMMGYIGLAGYEAAVPGMPKYNSLAYSFASLNVPTIDTSLNYNWALSANAAYAKIFKYFYPHISSTDLDKIAGLELQLEKSLSASVDKEIINRSIAFGQAVAEAVFLYSKTDTYGHEAFKNPRPSSYTPPKTGPNGEKLWQPTFPDFTPALFPYWGKVRPFAMKQSDLRAKAPIPYSEEKGSKFYQQALETKAAVDNLTFEDKWIAEFWSDDFFEVTFEPAARQIAIANQMAIEGKIHLDQAVELYAKMGMAMSDAAVAIWNSKYIYNVRRPIEYIREVLDPHWKTALNHPYTGVKSLTPEFPAYPSGHSGFGASGATVLTDIFGNNHEFTDNCHRGRIEFLSIPRTFNSFTEAAVENAYSRIPLGVHYRMDCDEGVRLGNLAGVRVLSLPWKD